MVNLSAVFGKKFSRTLPVAVIALLAGSYAFAQETTAGIQGSVRDASGGAVPNATVEVASPALIGTRKIQTDESGNYRMTALAPGQYSLTVTAAGFRTYKL